MSEGFEYVFQNYIYVPIISSIIGGVISVFTPKLIKKNKKNNQKNI